jgi:hypothetical protein
VGVIRLLVGPEEQTQILGHVDKIRVAVVQNRKTGGLDQGFDRGLFGNTIEKVLGAFEVDLVEAFAVFGQRVWRDGVKDDPRCVVVENFCDVLWRGDVPR